MEKGMKDRALADLIDMDDPPKVLKEVKAILAMMFSDFDSDIVEKVFIDIQRLFKGDYPGYRKCTTQYHDLKHATDTFLAMSRLIHGAVLNGEQLSRAQVSLGLICALMHDTGYIQTIDDNKGTGAKYTGKDTTRSIAFMDTYITDNKLPIEDFTHYADILICAGLDTRVSELHFASHQIAQLGMMLGTADLMGQMADRTYLEKLLLLYAEFREGEITDYKDELDLLKKTKGFYERIKKRLSSELGGVSDYVQYHFKVRWNIDRNLYTEAIESNVSYLNYILKNHEKDYRRHLRREKIMKRLRKRGEHAGV
jgi:hypothetical protein